jgi:hypothetical protein
MPTPLSPRSTPVVGAALDVVLLIVFVLIGRASHGEGLLGFLVTLWPFLAGTMVGWLICRAWRAPAAVLWTGIVVWLSTVLIGMSLRAISGQGVQLSFVIVTVVVLGFFFLGWRTVLRLIDRSRVGRSATRR